MFLSRIEFKWVWKVLKEIEQKFERYISMMVLVLVFVYFFEVGCVDGLCVVGFVVVQVMVVEGVFGDIYCFCYFVIFF